MYNNHSYEVAYMVDGPYDGECTAVEPGKKKEIVMRVNTNSKTIVKQPVGWYQNTKIKDTEGRFIFLWQGWEDE